MVSLFRILRKLREARAAAPHFDAPRTGLHFLTTGSRAGVGRGRGTDSDDERTKTTLSESQQSKSHHPLFLSIFAITEFGSNLPTALARGQRLSKAIEKVIICQRRRSIV
eukprot:213931-Rhodomonas_salina.1